MKRKKTIHILDIHTHTIYSAHKVKSRTYADGSEMHVGVKFADFFSYIHFISSVPACSVFTVHIVIRFKNVECDIVN